MDVKSLVIPLKKDGIYQQINQSINLFVCLTSIYFYFIWSFSWNLPELSTPVSLFKF